MPTISGSDIHKLVVACDAGMGSSVMLASQLRKQLKKQAVEATRPGVPVVPFQIFLGDPAVAKVVAAVQNGTDLDV